MLAYSTNGLVVQDETIVNPGCYASCIALQTSRHVIAKTAQDHKLHVLYNSFIVLLFELQTISK